MQAIAWRWAAAIGWLFVGPSLAREGTGVSIGPEAGALGAGVAIALVAIPGLRRLDVRASLVLVLPLFLGLQLLTGGGGAQGPLAGVVELGYVAGAVVLATGIGRRMIRFEEVLESLTAPGEEARAAPFDTGQEDLYHEIRRARRFERPAALVAFSASGADALPGGRLTTEVLQEITERYAAAQIGSLLLLETDAASVVTRRGDHFVVLLPETDGNAARQAAQRLAGEAERRWGLELRWGIASFPDQEVTLDGLLERAEAELQAVEHGRASTRVRTRRSQRTGFHISEVGKPRAEAPSPRSGT
jgi:hypothetical protein